MPLKKKINFIDLFSGAGGFSCGLEMAGFNCLLGVDFNKDAIKTFERNHPLSKSYCGDIKKLKNKDISKVIQNKKVDLIVGGPPCQGFSTVGTGNPEDERNTLFKEFLRIVKHVSPSFVVMENVTGLLAKKNEKNLLKIFQMFKRLGYTADVKILSAEKFGVPERRRRTIFIATKLNTEIVFPTITHGTEEGLLPLVTVSDAFKNLKSISGNTFNHDLSTCVVKDKIDLKRLKRIPEGKGIRYQKDEKAYLTRSTYYEVDWEKLPEKRFRQTKLQRLDRTSPSPTIMTHRHSYYHPTEHRYISAREAAAVQSFPNDFEFIGTTTSVWRQIGNAVPPILAYKIGNTIKEMLKSKNKRPSKNKTKEQILQERKVAFVYKN
tara:strand:- start:1221 stop:2354 length:1134 start_codon:yes stop_codon:yes gene_type:complete